MTIGSLFSGIGGLELGLEWSGLGPVIWQVEKEEKLRNCLATHWPDAERFEDVCTVGKRELRPVDLICGGFPCQDVSSLGKRAGLDGARSGLWFEFARILGELRPRWAVIENVTSGATKWVDAVRLSLEQCGYESLPVPLSAWAVGAPHKYRKRVFLVAHAKSVRSGKPHKEKNTIARGGEARALLSSGVEAFAGRHAGWAVEPDVARVVHGFPGRVDRERALGNSVVPQCAEVIGHLIQLMEC